VSVIGISAPGRRTVATRKLVCLKLVAIWERRLSALRELGQIPVCPQTAILQYPSDHCFSWPRALSGAHRFVHPFRPAAGHRQQPRMLKTGQCPGLDAPGAHDTGGRKNRKPPPTSDRRSSFTAEIFILTSVLSRDHILSGFVPKKAPWRLQRSVAVPVIFGQFLMSARKKHTFLQASSLPRCRNRNWSGVPAPQLEFFPIRRNP